MRSKFAIPALAACVLIGGTALADERKAPRSETSAGSVAGGAAAAGPDGAVAGGGAASKVKHMRQGRRHARDRDNQANRNAACLPGTASTSTSGAAYTDRRRGSAAINTSGTASGSGTVRSSSEGDVFSSTDKSGSTADAYGVSDAVAREPSRAC